MSGDQLHSAPTGPDEARVESGGYVEPGYPWRYRLSIACGVQWLGVINDVSWRTDVGPSLPAQWRSSLDADGTIDLEILLLLEPEPRIDATAAAHTVSYRPSADPAPPCD